MASPTLSMLAAWSLTSSPNPRVGRDGRGWAAIEKRDMTDSKPTTAMMLSLPQAKSRVPGLWPIVWTCRKGSDSGCPWPGPYRPEPTVLATLRSRERWSRKTP